jgi:hypothetical protein
LYLASGGTDRVIVDNSGVRLGDTGNGYFQPVSGNYGSIQIDGGAHSGYEGYSIGGEYVFMSNGSTVGIYNDIDNEWMFRADRNAYSYMYFNGSPKLTAHGSGVDVSGSLNAVDNIYVANNIYHEGDTNTYINFGSDSIWFFTGGSAYFLLGAGYINTQNVNMRMFNGSVYEGFQDLGTGSSFTCDANDGAFAATMNGNTTFTFSTPAYSGYSRGFILELTGNGSTVTWPSSVEWAGGTAPDAPASGETDIYVFWTRDGGSNWYGVQSIDAAA